MNLPLTTGQQTVTATGPVTPTTGLDISGVTADCTVRVRIQGLTAATGKAAVSITIEDSVNAFTAAVPVAEIEALSTVDPRAEQQFVFRKYQLPSCRFGVAGAVLRVNVVALTGTTPSLTLDAWLEE